MIEALDSLVARAHQLADAHEHSQVMDVCTKALEQLERPEPAALEGTVETATELYFLRGDTGRYIGQWAMAQADFGRCYEIALAGHVWDRAARALRLQGEVSLRLKQTEAAVASFQRSIELSQAYGDRFGALFTSARLARALSDLGNQEEARRWAEQTLSEVQQTPPTTPGDQALLWATVHNALGIILFRLGELEAAWQAASESYHCLPLIQHDLTVAETFRLLAILEGQRRQFSTAIDYLHRALQIYDRVKYEPGRYDAYWSLGITYIDLGDLRNARLCLAQCEKIATALGLPMELGKAQAQLGDIALREGQYEKALELYLADLETTTAIGDRQALGYCHRNVAEAYRLLGRQADAEAQARASIRQFSETGRRTLEALARLELARCLVLAQRCAEAEEEARTARQILAERKQHWALAEAHAALGLIARERGALEEAERWLEESLAAQQDGPPTRLLAETYYEAGQTLYQRGKQPEALHHLRRAIELAGQLESQDIRLKAVQLMEDIDRVDALRMKLAPYVSMGAVDELSLGWRGEDHQETIATMMFVDMRGSTAMSGYVDPLEMARTVEAFLSLVVRIILKNGGTVDKFIGDCVMAVFGLQGADDGARAAVLAGLEIIDYLNATTRVRQQAGASTIEATIGINTGRVLASCFGPLLRRDYTVLGYAVNLAERLQDLASDIPTDLANRLVISGSTFARTADLVQAERLPREQLSLKGINVEDVEAWFVRGRAVGAASPCPPTSGRGGVPVPALQEGR